MENKIIEPNKQAQPSTSCILCEQESVGHQSAQSGPHPSVGREPRDDLEVREQFQRVTDVIAAHHRDAHSMFGASRIAEMNRRSRTNRSRYRALVITTVYHARFTAGIDAIASCRHRRGAHRYNAAI
jgi:hypothetical protein